MSGSGTPFYEGQEVEVYTARNDDGPAYGWQWRKAKIIQRDQIDIEPEAYIVEFHDGTRAVFPAKHIRKEEFHD